MTMQTMKKTDDGFTVKKTPYGLYTSVDLDGKELVTSATEHQCRPHVTTNCAELQQPKHFMTHFFLNEEDLGQLSNRFWFAHASHA